MPSCCVINCNNSSNKSRLFRLPTGDKNKERREIWIKNIARKNWNPDVGYICEVHFSADQFEQNRADGRKLLKWNAIPSLFLTNGQTKLTSRFRKRGKTAATANDVEHVKQESTTLILPQIVTVPNGDVAKLNNEKIVFIKFEPKNERGCVPKGEIDDVTTNTILKEDILYLKRKVRAIETKVKDLQSIKSHFSENLHIIFNSDQIQFMEEKRSDNIVWSNQTVDKAIRLFKACGEMGYKEIERQNLPFPSLELLRKFQTDLVSQELLEILDGGAVKCE